MEAFNNLSWPGAFAIAAIAISAAYAIGVIVRALSQPDIEVDYYE